MSDTGGTLKRTTHKTLGHAPASIADYETAFSPNLETGGWHRGDGCFSVHGTGWSLFCFNDFFVSAAGGTVNPLFRRNSVLMVDAATGLVTWLSSGDQFALAGSVTFPAPDGSGTWCWLKGGWATGADSAILLAGRWNLSGEIDLRVMGIEGVTAATPTVSAVVTTDLSPTIRWAGQPFAYRGHVYVYGIKISTLTHHIARHELSADPDDYAEGWTYWSGTTWASSVGSAGALTISSAGLSPLNVRPWIWGFIGTAKVFDTAPELEIDDEWPDLHAWWAPTLMGPWWWIGHVYTPVSVEGWYSYLARLDYLPGIDSPVAIWSLNKADKSDAEAAVYGPSLAPAITPAGGHGSVSAAMSAAGTASIAGSATGALSVSAAPAGSGASALGRGT